MARGSQVSSPCRRHCHRPVVATDTRCRFPLTEPCRLTVQGTPLSGPGGPVSGAPVSDFQQQLAGSGDGLTYAVRRISTASVRPSTVFAHQAVQLLVGQAVVNQPVRWRRPQPPPVSVGQQGGGWAPGGINWSRTASPSGMTIATPSVGDQTSGRKK